MFTWLRWRSWSRRRVAILAVLLVLAGGSAGAAMWYLRVESHLASARAALEQHDDEQARQELDVYLATWPRCASARLLAAQTARRLRRYDDASDHLVVYRANGGDPDTIDTEDMLSALQRGVSAMEPLLWKRAEAHDQNELAILEVLIQHYIDTYRLHRALECLNRYLDQRPDDLHALLGRAFVWERFLQFADAARDYRTAVERHPDSDPARLRLAKTLLIVGTPQEAMEHFQHLVERRPDWPAARLGLAQCRRRLDNRAEARQFLDELIKQQPKYVEALVERADLALDDGDLATAETSLRAALKLAPHDRKANYTLYRCLSQLGRDKDAQAALAQVERIDANLKRLDHLTKAVLQSPHDAGLRCQVGLLFLENGEEQEGVRWLQGALSVDPHCQEAQRGLAEYLRKKH